MESDPSTEKWQEQNLRFDMALLPWPVANPVALDSNKLTNKRKRNRQSGGRRPSEIELEKEAMTGVDPSLVFLGPPTLQDLEDMVGNHVTLIDEDRRLVGISMQHGYVTAHVNDPNIPSATNGAAGKQFYLGAYPSEEEASRASDKMKIKRYLCGWRCGSNVGSVRGRQLVKLCYHPTEYLEEMCLPEVVAMTNWAKYRTRLRTLANANVAKRLPRKKAKLAE